MNARRRTPEPPKLGLLEWRDGESLDLDYYLGHDFDDISQASQQLPPIIEWVNIRLQEAKENQLCCRQQVKYVEARTFFDLKDGRYVTEGFGVKFTDKSVEKAAVLDAKVQAAQENYACWCGWVSRLQNLLFSLQAKLELVRSSEATRRKLVSDEVLD